MRSEPVSVGRHVGTFRNCSIFTLCALATGCSTTAQVDQVNAHRAQAQAECQSKGYQPGSPDFQTCLQVVAMNQSAASGMATSVALMPLAILGAFVSDARLKQDVVRIGTVGKGIGLYRFRYLGAQEQFVGVLAHEVQRFHPHAVVQGPDGYLRVHYARLGLSLRTWADWQAASR